MRESSSWDGNPANRIHRVVRQLVQRAIEYVPIETVLCDREFDSMRVFQTLSNLGVNHLIPKPITSSECEVIERMDEDDQEVAVESASVHEAGRTRFDSCACSRRAVKGQPSSKRISESGWMRPRRSVGATVAAVRSKTYTRALGFLAKTSLKDYHGRLFHFVFAMLLYNIRRLTDFLLKADVDGEMDYAPVLTASECVEIVPSALIPPD